MNKQDFMKLLSDAQYETFTELRNLYPKTDDDAMQYNNTEIRNIQKKSTEEAVIILTDKILGKIKESGWQ